MLVGVNPTLVSEVEGVENITGSIERTDSEGVLKEVHCATRYSAILAYDSTGRGTTPLVPESLSIRRNIIIIKFW